MNLYFLHYLKCGLFWHFTTQLSKSGSCFDVINLRKSLTWQQANDSLTGLAWQIYTLTFWPVFMWSRVWIHYVSLTTVGLYAGDDTLGTGLVWTVQCGSGTERWDCTEVIISIRSISGLQTSTKWWVKLPSPYIKGMPIWIAACLAHHSSTDPDNV